MCCDISALRSRHLTCHWSSYLHHCWFSRALDSETCKNSYPGDSSCDPFTTGCCCRAQLRKAGQRKSTCCKENKWSKPGCPWKTHSICSIAPALPLQLPIGQRWLTSSTDVRASSWGVPQNCWGVQMIKILGNCAWCRRSMLTCSAPRKERTWGSKQGAPACSRGGLGKAAPCPGTWRQTYINTYQFSLRICRLSSAGTEQSYVSSSHLLPPCTASRGCSPALLRQHGILIRAPGWGDIVPFWWGMVSAGELAHFIHCTSTFPTGIISIKPSALPSPPGPHPLGCLRYCSICGPVQADAASLSQSATKPTETQTEQMHW